MAVCAAPRRRWSYRYLCTDIVAQYRKHTARPADLIEFAFPGDVLGFGFLDYHIAWAQAVGEARVRCVPLSAVSAILRNNKRAFHRYAEALQREFEFRRDELAKADRSPLHQTAALFVALSGLNQHEGRDPCVVTDSLECGTVAAWLGMDVDVLADALVELEQSGLIQRHPPHGLRLMDLAGLQRLADNIPQSDPPSWTRETASPRADALH